MNTLSTVIVERYPADLIVKSTRLTQREKLMLLAIVAVHSFDAEGRCGFRSEQWPAVASACAINPITAARYWMRLRDAGVIRLNNQDRNAPYPYHWIDAHALVAMEPPHEQ